MADSIKVNSSEVAGAIEKFSSITLRNALEGRLQKAALIVVADAKRNAPVKTGHLRNSIIHEVDGDNLVAVVGSNVEYAPYQEVGTGRNSSRGDGSQAFGGIVGKHYLENAVTDNVSKILKCFEGLI